MKRKILIISLSVILLALIVFTVYPAPKIRSDSDGGINDLCVTDVNKVGVMISRPLGLCTDFSTGGGFLGQDSDVILPGFVLYNLVDGCDPSQERNKLPGGKQCDWSKGEACCKQLGYRYFENPIEPISIISYTWGLWALAALIVSFFFGGLIFFGLEKRISKKKAFLIPAIILQILVIIYYFAYLV